MDLSRKVILKKFNWTKDQTAFVAGFIWLNGRHLSEKEFAEYISCKSTSFEDFSNTIQPLNGQFSIIVEKNEEIWLATSHTWSYPLFYKNTNEGIFISDEPTELLFDEKVTKLDSFSEIYFLNFGVTPLSKTLIKDIFQVQPGEIIRFKIQSLEITSFLPFSDKSDLRKDNVSENELHDFLCSTFEKYFNTIKNKQVLLPLTRGYDSRLLACLLKEFGHNNVICATWGRFGSSEIQTAKRVAGQLGYKHFFVDYSKVIKNDFTNSTAFKSYIDFAGHFSSMPFLYEYFGVKELIEKKIIDKKTVALPGHPGDFIRGNHIGWDVVKGDRDYLASKIISKFGTSFPVKLNERQTLNNYIITEFLNDKVDSLRLGYELWDFKERQCKFIGNSSQIFAFFGMQSMMPLFDLDVLKFFNRVPDKQKIEQNIYYSTLENRFFKKLKVDFDLKPTELHQSYNSLKEGLLKFVPHAIKKLYYPLNDDIYYREITKELQTGNKNFRVKHPVRPNAYNSYIIQWYLFSLQQSFRKSKKI